MKDLFGRQIEYLRLSVTDRCNMRCRYCMPSGGISKQSHDVILRNEEFVHIAGVMTGLGISKIRLTGGEPLVRKGLPGLLYDLRSLPGIREVSLTTNGSLLADQLDELMKAGLSRVNISIDSLKPDVYAELTRGGNLSDVKRGISAAQEKGLFPIKLNVVVIQGVNTNEIDSFLDLAEKGIEVRFIELMPVGEAAGWSRDRFTDLNRLISSRSDLLPLPDHGDGGPCRYYRRIGGEGVIGVISPLSDHFCSSCNRLRVTSDGMLRTCLHSNSDTDLKPYLAGRNILLPEEWKQMGQRDYGDPLKAAIIRAIMKKPNRHRMLETSIPVSTRNMNRIGG